MNFFFPVKAQATNSDLHQLRRLDLAPFEEGQE